MNCSLNLKPLLKINLQTQPDNASCFITSIAMILGEPVEDLIKEVGINHKLIVAPGKPGSLKYRGHDPQDFSKMLIQRGWALMIMYKKYNVSPLFFNSKCFGCGGTGKYKGVMESGDLLIQGNVGLLQYGNHICAWDGEKIYNPCGEIQKFHTTRLIGFHPMFRIQPHDLSNRS